MVIDVLSMLYFLVVLCIFWILPSKSRRFFMLLAGMIYIGYTDRRALYAVLITSVIFYFTGTVIEKSKQNNKMISKVLFVGVVLLSILSLCIFKYGKTAVDMGYISDSYINMFVVPIGYSFYILGSISYLSDIYKEKRIAEKSMLNYFLYMCWFPKFVSGPIEDEERLSIQFNTMFQYRLSFETFKLAFLRIIYGIFVKLVVADRLGLYVNDLYNNKTEFGSISLIIGTILYSMQIYCDFAGYTTIARGASLLFGVELTENFITPYLSENIGEFWRRWHISLSSWLKKYIYIPLGGNRKGDFRKYINYLIVFLISGFWHGATAAFLIWGFLHGIFSVLNCVFQKFKLDFFTKGISGRIINFIEVSFAWIFFRAGSIREACLYIKCMFFNGVKTDYLIAHYGGGLRQVIDPAVTIAFMLMIIIFDLIAYKKNKDIPTVIAESSDTIKVIFTYALVICIFIFGNYGASILEKTLIYMNF